MKLYLTTTLALAVALGTGIVAAGEWRTTGDPNEIAWYEGGLQLGNYRLKTDDFLPLLGGRFGTPCRPPAEPPFRFGVVADQLGGAGYRINGRVATREEVLARLGRDSLQDDTARLRLTVWGDAADRERALAAVRQQLGRAADQVLVQSYPADHWSGRVGFETGGSPSIYLQMPDGKVLWRADSDRDLAGLAEAVRRADPNYDPLKDPSPLRPALPSLPAFDPTAIPWWAWLAAGGLATLFLLPTQTREVKP